MKLLHLQAVGGASGDMILGALMDLGVARDRLQSALESLGVGPFTIIAERGESQHLAGLRATVEVPRGAPDAHTARGHAQDHHHHDDGHAHRSLTEIVRIIRASSLPDLVKQRSVAVFTRIGEVEARMHNVPIDHIHFHEIGAVDSIVDIVGSCLALHELGVDGVSIAPLPQGVGTIACAHGTYPNPAPATLELLRGMPIEQTDEPFELVTPTGAALLAQWKTHDAPPAGARVATIGYGLGQRTLRGRANLLRAMLLDVDDAAAEGDACVVLETNLDDSTPEIIGVLVERLLSAGALDVLTIPAQMKKQRPGVLVQVLATPEKREAMIDTLFRESSTFGVREHRVTRSILARRHETVATPYGEVRVKVGSWRGRDITRSPEMDDCIARAREHGVAARDVYEAAIRRSGP